MDVPAASQEWDGGGDHGNNTTEGGSGGRAAHVQFQQSHQTSDDANSLIEVCQGQIKFFEFSASQRIDRETRIRCQDKNEDN